MPVVLAAAVVAAFANGARGAFVLDDTNRIVDNPTLAHLWPPPTPGSLASRPVLHFTLALNHAVGGLDPWGYHLVNIAIHALACLTLFGVVRRTLAGPGIPVRFAARAPQLAFAIALFWALHPLQTAAVTYVIQRGESLASLFYLLTVYTVIRSAGSRRPWTWNAAAVVACALGMGTKEIAATAPIVVLLYDRMFLAGSVREMLRQRGLLHAALAATMVLPFLLVARVPGGEATGFTGSVAEITPGTYALTQCAVVPHYLRLALWPHPLVLDYGWRPANSLGEVAVQGSVLVALLVATCWALLRGRLLGFAGAFFFLVLAPTSSFIPIADVAFEHRMYLPLAAVAVVLVLGADLLLDRLEQRGSSQLVRSLVLLAVAAALGSLTVRRNADYESPLAMWSDVAAKRPLNSRAQFNLGNAFDRLGRTDEAIEHFREAIRLDPDFPHPHVNLGLALVRKGDVEEAIEHYRRALELKKDWSALHFHLGAALRMAGRNEEALANLLEALRLQPESVLAQIETGGLLVSMRRAAEAVPHLREATRIRPESADAQYVLGLALNALGQTVEAQSRFREAIRLRPEYPEACNNLGVILFKSGRVQEAVGFFEQALRWKPDYAEASRNLELARHSRGHGRSNG